MCLDSSPAQVAPAAPAPVVIPKPMVTPEQAAGKAAGNTTGGLRAASSRSALRLDLGGTAGSSGLNIPV